MGITSDWDIDEVKGFAGTLWSWPPFRGWMFTCTGCFDEAARSILHNSPEVVLIQEDVILYLPIITCPQPDPREQLFRTAQTQ